MKIDVGKAPKFTNCGSVFAIWPSSVVPASSSGKVIPNFVAIDGNLPQIALRVVDVLVRQSHDLKTLIVILAIEIFQHRRFVVAVGTPGSEDVDDQRLAFELRAVLIHASCRQHRRR